MRGKPLQVSVLHPDIYSWAQDMNRWAGGSTALNHGHETFRMLNMQFYHVQKHRVVPIKQITPCLATKMRTMNSLYLEMTLCSGHTRMTKVMC